MFGNCFLKGFHYIYIFKPYSFGYKYYPYCSISNANAFWNSPLRGPSWACQFSRFVKNSLDCVAGGGISTYFILNIQFGLIYFYQIKHCTWKIILLLSLSFRYILILLLHFYLWCFSHLAELSDIILLITLISNTYKMHSSNLSALIDLIFNILCSVLLLLILQSIRWWFSGYRS